MTEVDASSYKDGAIIDTEVNVVRTPRTTTIAFVIGDADQIVPSNNTISTEGCDMVYLYVDANMDAGSTVTELRIRVTFGMEAANMYDEVALDTQLAAGGIIDVNLEDIEYVLAVAAGNIYAKRLALMTDETVMEVALMSDAAGHANDLVGITYVRRMREV